MINDYPAKQEVY